MKGEWKIEVGVLAAEGTAANDEPFMRKPKLEEDNCPGRVAHSWVDSDGEGFEKSRSF